MARKKAIRYTPIEGTPRLLQELELMALSIATVKDLEGADMADLQARFQELQLRYEAQFKCR